MKKKQNNNLTVAQYLSRLEQEYNDELNLAIAVPPYYFNTPDLERLLALCRKRYQYMHSWQEFFLRIGFAALGMLIAGVICGIWGEKFYAVLLIQLFFKTLCLFIGGLIWLKIRFEQNADLADLSKMLEFELRQRQSPPSRRSITE
jgi:hypothetical protein